MVASATVEWPKPRPCPSSWVATSARLSAIPRKQEKFGVEDHVEPQRRVEAHAVDGAGERPRAPVPADGQGAAAPGGGGDVVVGVVEAARCCGAAWRPRGRWPGWLVKVSAVFPMSTLRRDSGASDQAAVARRICSTASASFPAGFRPAARSRPRSRRRPSPPSAWGSRWRGARSPARPGSSQRRRSSSGGSRTHLRASATAEAATRERSADSESVSFSPPRPVEDRALAGEIPDHLGGLGGVGGVLPEELAGGAEGAVPPGLEEDDHLLPGRVHRHRVHLVGQGPKRPPASRRTRRVPGSEPRSTSCTSSVT
jgi:hypothetical protein